MALGFFLVQGKNPKNRCGFPQYLAM